MSIRAARCTCMTTRRAAEGCVPLSMMHLIITVEARIDTVGFRKHLRHAAADMAQRGCRLDTGGAA